MSRKRRLPEKIEQPWPVAGEEVVIAEYFGPGMWEEMQSDAGYASSVVQIEQQEWLAEREQVRLRELARLRGMMQGSLPPELANQMQQWVPPPRRKRSVPVPKPKPPALPPIECRATIRRKINLDALEEE